MTRTSTSGRDVRAVAAGLAVAALVAGCSGDDGDPVAGTTSSAPTTPASAGSPAPSPTDGPSPTTSAPSRTPSQAPTATASPDPVPTTLVDAPFSGYGDVADGVVAWVLECPPDFAPPAPEGASAMGTARQDLDDQVRTVRQVAVFPTPEAAVRAADALGAYAREQCAGEYEPQPGFVASRSTVEPLGVGDQGLLVDTTAEDSTSATAVLRRGTAVAVVLASAAPTYPEGRTAVGDVRAGAEDVFGQLCTYEAGAC